MTANMKTLLCVLTLLVTRFALAQQPALDKKGWLVSPDSVDISRMVKPVPEANRFVLPDYNIWCGSMVRGNNGKYYLLYARWPKANGHYAWVTHSEIALARADKPEGPYQHVKSHFAGPWGAVLGRCLYPQSGSNRLEGPVLPVLHGNDGKSVCETTCLCR